MLLPRISLRLLVFVGNFHLFLLELPARLQSRAVSSSSFLSTSFCFFLSFFLKTVLYFFFLLLGNQVTANYPFYDRPGTLQLFSIPRGDTFSLFSMRYDTEKIFCDLVLFLLHPSGSSLTNVSDFSDDHLKVNHV